MSYQRTFTLDRAKVNEETGEFRAVLFTDGEASDGHILNISGGFVPRQMPLFVNHWADPREQLGSIFFERKTAHQIHVRGQIFLDGEGPEASIRRDIMAKIAAGHVSRMSGRWDAEPEDVKRRTDLDKGHPAYVNPEKVRGRKRYGLYFEKWVGQEGSVVGLGADPQATMRWAEDEELPEEVRNFWRSQVEAIHREQESEPVEDESEELENDNAREDGTSEEVESENIVEVVTQDSTDLKVRVDKSTNSEPPSEEARLAAFGAQIRELLENGVELDDLKSVVEENTRQEEEVDLNLLLQRVQALEEKIDSFAESGRVDGSPPEPLPGSPASILRRIKSELQANREESLAEFRELLEERRGRIKEARTADVHKEAIAHLRALLRSSH